MKRRISLGVTIALMAITATLTLSLTYQFAIARFGQQISFLNERQKMYAKLHQVDQKARENYLFPIDETQLGDAIADGYVNGLGDLHSQYLSQSECAQRQQELSGKMVGIGMELVQMDDGGIVVIRVTPGSPAEAAGVQKGDVLLAIDGTELTEENYAVVDSLVYGEVGAQLELRLLRDEEELTVSAVRREFDIVSVEARLLPNSLGYIHIYEFNDQTDEAFEKAVDDLTRQGAAGLILDVRNNPGGSLEAVANILDMILPAGNIVSAADKSGEKEVLYTSDAVQLDLPLAVLVNESSASASELLAAAVQDYKKGTVIELFSFADGSALNLTIARFYPPLSDNFDGVGVVPNIKIELSEEQQKNFYFLSDEEDPQLSAAVSALVIGGAAPQEPAEGDEPPSSAEEVETASEEQQEGVSSLSAYCPESRQYLRI